MARMGNKPVAVTDEVTVDVSSDNEVTVSGPKGDLVLQMDSGFTVEAEDDSVVISRPTDQRRHREMHGMYRSRIDGMVVGVTEGYRKELRIVGIGYRASVNGGVLELNLGFSHPIYFMPPEEIDFSVQSERGEDPIVIIEGADKELVGQVAAKIRELRPPEPYKGKGIRYVGEQIERKAGKTAAAR